ncbi:MAG: biotin--[acetyl-CoA-carboxylase] ligase [Crocinitomicaceae bacterium]|nr:biotin--[acetyl-CoA-carboxylase] ligase [Crocinitomicaceae bacterium]
MHIGQNIIHLACVDSTNNYAANCLKSGDLTSGTVILADEQFAGKGQRGAEWSTLAGLNLTFSFFVDNVNMAVARQFDWSKIVALGIHRFLEKLGVETSIKWPNDIYCNDSKIAGILIENQLSGSLIKSSIVGIGINVNQQDFKGFNATSLFLETGTTYPIKDALLSFIDSMNGVFKDVVQGELNVELSYLDQLYRKNEMHPFEDSSGRFFGVVQGVAPNGRLIVKKQSEIVTYDLKEIRFC